MGVIVVVIGEDDENDVAVELVEILVVSDFFFVSPFIINFCYTKLLTTAKIITCHLISPCPKN